MRSGPGLALLIVAVAVGCTGSPSRTADPVDVGPDRSGPDEPAATTAPHGSAEEEAPPIVGGSANSLVLVLDGATLTSVGGDGTTVATYASGDDLAVWQPIWAPDGRRVAWTRTSDGATWELVTAAVDGTDRTVHTLPGRPDYVTYDPTGSVVLALTPSPVGFGLVAVDVLSTAEPRVVDVGVPYFSDVAPDGDRLVAHVGDGIRLVELDGSTTALGVTSLGHQTPAWHPSDDIAFFTVDDDGGNVLVARDLATGRTTELAAFDDFVLFDLDPTGTHLAVSAIGLPDSGGIEAFRSSPSFGGGVWVIDVDDRAARRVGDRPTAAPMWDPTGTRILARTSIAGVGRWVVHDLSGTFTSTDAYDVDGSLLPAYLPFWDQYARSQTVWSPDGARFVHVGAAPDGRSGVWVHDATTGGPSLFLVAGDLAFWSPT